MAEPAAPIPRPRLELSLLEARTRFVQLARLANLTRQSTIITEGGRPIAAIVPADSAPGGAPGGASGPAPGAGSDAASGGGSGTSAAGWLRRIETLRADLQRQHRALEVALDEAWRELDRVRPPGSDPGVDALRLAHADVRRR